MADGQRDQPVSRVGDAGHAGIGDQRDLRAAFEVHDQLGGPGHLVVLVIADGARLDAVVAEQLLGLARVLAGDQVDFFEHAQGAQGDVLEIADGRGDEVERRPRPEAAAVVRGFGLSYRLHIQSLTTKAFHHRGTEEVIEKASHHGGTETRRKTKDLLRDSVSPWWNFGAKNCSH